MNCPNHPRAEATGYCSVCAEFGCPDCLTLHEGNLLCERHYRPIARKIEEEKRQEQARKRNTRQRLVVHYKDGRREYGVCFAMNLRETGFHLDLMNTDDTPLEKTSYVRFGDLKAVFLVRSFDGKSGSEDRGRDPVAQGDEVLVQFVDGEVIRGFCMHRFDPNEPRFHLIPGKSGGNNISIIVEMSAVTGVFTPAEYKAKLAAEQGQGSGESTLSQEESTGDFYLETRNYVGALEQYRLAHAKFPQVRRLHKKLFVAECNVGIYFIKHREYPKALGHMENALKLDPNNERVKKKVAQLRHAISKGAKSDVLED